MSVAIIDSGADLTHLLEQGTLAVNDGERPWPDGVDDDENGFVDDHAGWDAINSDGIPFDWPSTSASTGGEGEMSRSSHGSAMAELVTSVDSSNQTTVRIIRLFDGTTTVTTDHYREALTAAMASEVQVVLLALGGHWTEELAQLTIGSAGQGRAVFVLASGNDGDEIQEGTPLWNQCTASYVVCVAATHDGRLGTPFTLSNYGSDSVAVAAFGGPVTVSGLRISTIGESTRASTIPLTCVTSSRPDRREIALNEETPDGAVCPSPLASAELMETEGSSVAAACVAGGLASFLQTSHETTENALTRFLDTLETRSELTGGVRSGRVYAPRNGPCRGPF